MSLIIFLLSLAGSLHAATFHAVLVSDTEASHIAKGLENSLRHMVGFVKEAAKECDMPLTLHQLTGESLTLETLVALVHLLDVEEDDTILFCFWGHGIHCQWNLEPWPCLYFTKGEDYVAFEGVIELLRSFSPRLLIALADCCNTLIPAPLEARGEAAYQNNRRKQFAALFREPRGEVIITSAELGSNAYSFDSKGHVFTNGLIRSIMYQVKKQPLVTWESVLKMAEGQAIKWQRPYWEMHIR